MSKPVMLITGAAGFIGNAACKRYRERFHVIGIDDMSRETAIKPKGVEFYELDATILPSDFPPIDVLIHLAAQVSVTYSVADPIPDFHTNARGGLSVAMWAKEHKVRCLIYSSTNKVFGGLPEMEGVRLPVRDYYQISPRTPYGISKAMAGLYIRDLLPDCSYDFRQSCIYGEDQRGTEDQGWIGYLRRSIAEGRLVVCYGDGTQVRDLLHVSDLLNVYDLAINGSLKPGSYTVGGGLENAYSFSKVVEMLGGKIDHYEAWRPHDQRYFVSANDFAKEAHWRPYVRFKEWCEQITSSRNQLQTS